MIRLPTFTFLNGPAGSGKSTLAGLLQDQDEGMCALSFANPLREVLLATFYPEERFDNHTLDLRDEKVKSSGLPLAPNWTHRQFLIDYGAFLKSKTSEMFLGDLAKRSVTRFQEYYVRFVFDDARTIGDISPFINGYGAENCLLIRVERRGVSHKPGDVGTDDMLMKLPGIKRMIVGNNETPDKMLEFMHSVLGGVPTHGDKLAQPSLDQL